VQRVRDPEVERHVVVAENVSEEGHPSCRPWDCKRGRYLGVRGLRIAQRCAPPLRNPIGPPARNAQATRRLPWIYALSKVRNLGSIVAAPATQMSSTTAADAAGNPQVDDSFMAFLQGGLRRIFSAYTVDVSPPEAATPGGPHTLQRIRLLTSHRTPLILGWINVTQRRANLHTLGHTLALSKLRLGRELVAPPLEYVRFLETAKAILEDEGLVVEVVAYAKESAESGLRRSVDAPNRSMTLPFYVVDAMHAVSTLAERMGATPPMESACVEAMAPPPPSTMSGWATVLRWAPATSARGPSDVTAKRRSTG
jgi:hypothetical protein